MQQSQKQSWSKTLRSVIVLILWIILCVSASGLFLYYADVRTQNNFSESLAERVIIDDKIDFNKLSEESDDVIGWIYIENTPINYPVLQSSDNKYYLNRMMDGNYNQCGSIFADYRNASDFSDNNTLVYGHNMKSGVMFGSLMDFDYKNQCKAFLFTPKKTFEIAFLKGIRVDNTDDIYNFVNFDFMDKNSRYITLSTCINEIENQRYILIGELKEIGRDK